MDLIQLHKQYLKDKFNKEPKDIEPIDAVLGIFGEAGELLLNKEFLPWKKNNDIVNILEEITDMRFFVNELYLIYGINSDTELLKIREVCTETSFHAKTKKRELTFLLYYASRVAMAVEANYPASSIMPLIAQVEFRIYGLYAIYNILTEKEKDDLYQHKVAYDLTRNDHKWE